MERCIFCPHPAKRSSEHIWPQWFTTYIPRRFTHTIDETSLVEFANGGQVRRLHQRGILTRPGDPGDQRLKVVCAPCNNGWMSTLRVRARPFLEPLVKGDTAAGSSGHGLRSIAAWAAMFTIVYEQADLRTRTISETERFDFRLKRDIPTHWTVWEARHHGSQEMYCWHRCMDIVAELPLSFPDRIRDPANTQVTTLTIGKLLLQTISSGSEFVNGKALATFRSYGNAFGLTRLWPPVEAPTHLGIAVIGHEGVSIIATALSDALGVRKIGT